MVLNSIIHKSFFFQFEKKKKLHFHFNRLINNGFIFWCKKIKDQRIISNSISFFQFWRKIKLQTIIFILNFTRIYLFLIFLYLNTQFLSFSNFYSTDKKKLKFSAHKGLVLSPWETHRFQNNGFTNNCLIYKRRK